MGNVNQGSEIRSELHFHDFVGGAERHGAAKRWLRTAASSKAMILRIATEDIEELRRALSSAYGEVIRELDQSSGRADPVGIQLCRRKWKLQALLRQLDGPEEPPAVLNLVPRRNRAALEQAAA